jgi:hypothetical protein
MWQFLTNNINYTLQDDSVWDIMPCSLAEANRRLTNQGDDFWDTTQHNIPEGYPLPIRCRQNLKSHYIPQLSEMFGISFLKMAFQFSQTACKPASDLNKSVKFYVMFTSSAKYKTTTIIKRFLILPKWSRKFLNFSYIMYLAFVLQRGILHGVH